MAVYADPTRCPDCRTTLPQSPTTCPACGLPLRGPVVEELFATLKQADRLLGVVRASAAPAPTVGSPGVFPPPYPVSPSPELRRRGLSAPSVPVILLGLGAVCLLVAAVTFLAFAWAWLGVGGRTAVLLLFTAGAGVGTEVLRRRELRVAGEATSVITLGLLVMDVFGAGEAGWLGNLGVPGMLAILGLVMATPSVGWTFLARRGRSTPLVLPQLAITIGLSLVMIGWTVDTEEPYAGAAMGAAVLLGVAWASSRLGIAPLAVAAALGAALWWLPLTLAGLARVVDHATVSDLVADLHAWPIVVAAVLLVAATLLVRTSPAAVVAGLGTAATLLTLLPVVVAADNDGADLAWVLVAATLAWSVGLVRWPGRRGIAAVVPLGAVAAATSAVVLVLIAEAVSAAEDLFVDPWTHPWTIDLGRAPSLDPMGTPAAMLAPLVAAVVVAALAARLTFRGMQPALPGLGVRVAAGGLTVAAVVAASSEAPLVLVVGLVAVGGVGIVAWSVRDADRTSLADVAAGTVLLATALLGALASVGMTAVVAALLLAVAIGLVLRPASDDVAMLASLAAPALVALAGWATTDLASVPDAWRAAPLVLVLGLMIIRFPLPELEITAIASGATVAAISVVSAVHPEDALAAYLTLSGALLVASSVVNPERRFLAWAGGALLACATWVRLWDAGVTTPEAYTMPAALALLAVGIVRLARDDDADTWTTVSAGLLLATVPSLLTVMRSEPATLRALLLGLGCLGLVLAGTTLRWSAPLLVGAGVGLVLVLREWGPYAAEVPPWVVIGVAGSLLLVVGVTWEARLLELRRGAAYLARLR
jgi:hypothetical protein